MIQAFCIEDDKRRDCLTSCIDAPKNGNLLFIPAERVQQKERWVGAAEGEV